MFSCGVGDSVLGLVYPDTNGLGLALSHTSLFEAASIAGQLVRPYDGQIKMKERYFISELRSNEQTPASRAFLEWLDEQVVS